MQIQVTLTATDKKEIQYLTSILEMVSGTTANGIISAVSVDKEAEAVTKKKKVKEIEAPVKGKKKKEVEPEEDDDEDLDDEDESEDDSDDEESEDEDEDETEEDDEDSEDEDEDEEEKPAPKKRGRKPKAKEEKAVTPPVKAEKKSKDKAPKQADLIEAFSNLAKTKGRNKAKKVLEKLGVVSVRDIKEKDYAKALEKFNA